MKTVAKTSTDWELMNSQKPIWLRPPKEVCKISRRLRNAVLQHEHALGVHNLVSIQFVDETK